MSVTATSTKTWYVQGGSYRLSEDWRASQDARTSSKVTTALIAKGHLSEQNVWMPVGQRGDSQVTRTTRVKHSTPHVCLTSFYFPSIQVLRQWRTTFDNFHLINVSNCAISNCLGDGTWVIMNSTFLDSSHCILIVGRPISVHVRQLLTWTLFNSSLWIHNLLGLSTALYLTQPMGRPSKYWPLSHTQLYWISANPTGTSRILQIRYKHT